MPERFDLEYTGADGLKHRPIMIHTVAYGSLERFIGILTEHFAGAFPLWLAPVQVMVLPITDRSRDYAETVASRLKDAGLRAETDYRSEKIGYKIREAQMQKIPYMLVLGDKEAENGTVTVRKRSGGDQGAMNLEDFITALESEKKSRAH
jgi:threonyl-tRNA synthetase